MPGDAKEQDLNEMDAKAAAELAKANRDVIVGINRTPVRTASQGGDLLQSRSGAMRVYFERDGQINFTDLVFR